MEDGAKSIGKSDGDRSRWDGYADHTLAAPADDIRKGAPFLSWRSVSPHFSENLGTGVSIHYYCLSVVQEMLAGSKRSTSRITQGLRNAFETKL